ncbi:auxin-responsive protein SAUR36-like [Rutidosis leptorrhynchoides]|uniref:auxin-responsive protein SAUR36-like n=1 Tax=Rutidosis leptorrhynchoides TaxID=125765 RepID=UPI003A9A2A38
MKQQVRGFRIRLKLVKAIKWTFHNRKTQSSTYTKYSCTHKAMTRLCKLGQSLKKSMKKFCFSRRSNYIRIGQEMFCNEKPVPKGHMAVYFGEKEDDARRILVPVIYFNHPLFSDLLREAEKVYGFNHRGGIHVPCQVSEFENVQTRICATSGYGSYRRSWKNWV